MNEFTARKLGEVLAFSRLGVEIFEKGHQALEEGLPTSDIEATMSQLKDHVTRIESMAAKTGLDDVTLKKAEGTGNKLRSMLDLYVGDEWDNPAELLEWLGFFEGAAIVHWDLVMGAATSLNEPDLQELATTGREFHHAMLHTVEDSIKHLGAKKAL